ncbi:phosphate-starvation-inducible PsiE family protein [Petrachloros mirabilis]
MSKPHLFDKAWQEGWKRQIAVPDMVQVWESATRLTLGLLIATILLGLLGGVVKTFFDLRLLLSTNLETALRHIIVDALTLLAVVEVLKTTLTYCLDGRVRVTFIVDTVLVVMLTEIISRWFSGGDWQQFAVLGCILLTLGAIRVMAVRFSPTPHSPTHQGNHMAISGSSL